MVEKKETDLGSGSVGKLLIKLALPTIVAQIVNLLYNLVDRIYIGHIRGVGETALTGLGICLPIIMIVSAFAALVGSGGAPRASIAMGRGDRENAEKILGNCTALIFVLSVVLTVLLEIFAEPLLVLFGASKDTLPYALSYMRIYAAGNLFVMISLGLNAFVSAQGFAAVAMKTVMIGAAMNIALDPLFIFVFDLGVRGAAIATILSQCVSALWVMLFLFGKRTVLKIKMQYIRLKWKIIAPVLALGVSPFIMTATESILNISFNRSLSKYGGDVAVGAMTVLASIMQLLMMPTQGLAQGAQPIISYNYGAGKTDRVKKAYRLLFLCSITYTMVFTSVLYMFPEFFVKIFNDSSEELLKTAVWAMKIYFLCTGIFGIQMAAQQTFVALGQSKVSLFIACLRKIILLIPLIYILPYFFENKVFGVFLAEPIADGISVAVTATLFLIKIPKILKKNDMTKEKA